MKVKFLVVSLVVCLMLFGVGYVQDVIVGFLQIGLELGWCVVEIIVMQQQVKDCGIDLKFVDVQQKQENQIKVVCGFIV